MASFNKIIIVGHLGRDPELRYTPSGTAVCDFSMATSERKGRRDSGEGEEITTWFRVSLWGKQAELANQYLTKGKLVYIEGRLSQREYTDRDGNKRTSLEVNGTDMQFVGSRGDEMAAGAGGGRPSAPSGSREAPPASDAIGDDDIPF
ncbi:MAG: single-stranded DNA-binding protein [Blastocatellia bacterium]|nr:single-stranded DNA-binding protein [Blastocatellia bacterium]MBK6428379.1 single-stranded DNA-binding protein [Blastocatellia bacterium]